VELDLLLRDRARLHRLVR